MKRMMVFGHTAFVLDHRRAVQRKVVRAAAAKTDAMKHCEHPRMIMLRVQCSCAAYDTSGRGTLTNLSVWQEQTEGTSRTVSALAN